MILLVGMSENFFFNLMADIVNCEFYTIGYCYFCIPINVLSLSCDAFKSETFPSLSGLLLRFVRKDQTFL